MFTVVIPLYNKRQYICRCVESVLQQSCTSFEVIVVDDGSTDGSYNELNTINDDRLIVIHQENLGVSEARNTGINNAKGEWIAFIDADDMWFPDHLAELQKIIIAFPYAGLISTNYEEISCNENPYNVNRTQNSIKEINYFTEAAKKIGIICSSSAAVKRSVVAIVGGFKRYKAGEDLEFWARVALDYSVAISTKVTAIYFRTIGGAMDTLHPIKKNSENKAISLKDISPSVHYLESCKDMPKYYNKRSFIIVYINSRIYASIRRLLYNGNIKSTRHLLTLAISPIGIQLKFIQYLFIFPDIIISFLLFIYKKQYIKINKISFA